MKKLLSMVLLVAMCVSVFSAMVGSAAVAVSGEEMLLDPDMEQLAVGWKDILGYLPSAKISYTNEEYHNGEKSIKVSPTNGDYSWFTTTAYDFDPGKVYKFSIWVKGNGRIYIGVPCYDADGNPLTGGFVAAEDAKYGANYVWDNESKYADFSEFEVSADKWVQKIFYISAGGIVPEGTKSFCISIRTFVTREGSAPVVYYDDASLVAYDMGGEVNTSGMKNANATFGTKFWWSPKNGTVYDYDEYHSAPLSAKAAYGGTAGEFMREAQPKAWKLENGKRYECSIWLKTDTATAAPVQVLLHTQAVAYAMLTVNPTTEWKQYKTYFYPDNISQANQWCQLIICAQASGTAGNIWFDDVVVREADADVNSLLKDPTLSGCLDFNGNWGISGRGTFSTTENHGTDASSGSAELKFNKDEATTVNLFGSPIGTLNESGVNVENYVALDTTKEYELTFWAKGTSGTKSMFHVLMSPAINSQIVVPGYDEVVYPTTEWREYKFIVDVGKVAAYATAAGTTNNYTPYFSIRRTDDFEGAVYIDDITLCEVEYCYMNADLSVNTAEVTATATEGSSKIHGRAYFNTQPDGAEIIAAVYDQNGILKSCAAVSESELKAGHNDFILTVGEAVEINDTVKLFVLASADTLKPLKKNAVQVAERFPARILGRYERKDGAYSLNWPNSGVEFAFTGTQASIYFDKVIGTSYFTPYVDGVAGERILIEPGWNTIASGLSNEEHTIKFVRSSEASGGRTWASAISANKAEPTAEKERLIEFYGDSYTAGYGNLGVDGSGWGNPTNTDAQQAYSSVIANYFDADANLLAYSGKGLIQNGADNIGINMTAMSELADIKVNGDTTTPSKWDFTKHTPDLVVIFLGTNDYGGGPINTEFEAAYLEFIGDIRERYGDVKILCLSKGEKSFGPEVQNVVNTLNTNGDNNIMFYQFETFGASGAVGHPNVTEAAALAESLKQPIKDFMDW